jgi:hypothetical protein
MASIDQYPASQAINHHLNSSLLACMQERRSFLFFLPGISMTEERPVEKVEFI